MSDKLNIPDQDDVLAINERLTVENARLGGELTAATELLETATTQATTATQRAEELAGRLAALETAVKVAGEELTRVKAENSGLTARMADFNKAVAAEVAKLGLRPKAAEHKDTLADTDLSPTQRVLVAKGVGSIEELSPQFNP